MAQWVGTHPAIILEFEELRPGDNELLAAYRLLIKLGKLYGQALDIIVADGLYDGEPFRALCRRLGYYWVTRQKNELIDPGKAFRKAIDRRDPDRQNPDSRYLERSRQQQYQVWEESDIGYRFVWARRIAQSSSLPPAEPFTGACMTSLPADRAPAVAVAMLMETRWAIENTAFHELATAWKLDRPYVHAGRSVAVTMILILAFVAYNAMQTFFYRELGISPERPARTIGAICATLHASIGGK